MDEKQVQELLAQSVANIAGKLAELDRDTLVQLQAAEVAGGNRTTLLTAIDERLKALDADEGGESRAKPNPTGARDGEGEPAAKAAGKLSRDHWQHPDYHGALSGEQAAWRVVNLKPAAEVRRK